MNRKVLFVDDDESILGAYFRNFRTRFDLDMAQGGPQALRAMEEHGPYAVVVADLAMPGMNGIEFFRQAMEISADTVRIMLTGHAGAQTTMAAVNQGHVFRFLSKPCEMEALLMILEEGIHQYRLNIRERELLESTLTGSLSVLAELLSSEDPAAFENAQILADRAAGVARMLKPGEEWTLSVAAMLASIGMFKIPKAIRRKVREGLPLDSEERSQLEQVPELGADLLSHIPRMESVAHIIRYQAKHYSGAGFPHDDVAGEQIPLGARILRALIDFTSIEIQRSSAAVALEELRLHANRYDPKVLEAIPRVI